MCGRSKASAASGSMPPSCSGTLGWERAERPASPQAAAAFVRLRCWRLGCMVLPVWCCCMPQDVQVQSCQVPKCPCSAGPVHSRQACGDWGCTPGLVVPCLWSRIMLGRVSGMRVWPAALLCVTWEHALWASVWAPTAVVRASAQPVFAIARLRGASHVCLPDCRPCHIM